MEATHPEPPMTEAPPAANVPAGTSFTVSHASQVAPAPVRRGRGHFSHRLRSDEYEQEEQQQLAQEMNDAASVATAATTTVMLPSSDRSRTHAPPAEEDALEVFSQLKKDIPLTEASSTRKYFGAYGWDEQVDTVRQLLFRGEKRRRYCIIVGDLQNPSRQVTLKLFGHRGLKPFKLQNKLIRLVNLSIGKPRVRREETDEEAEEEAEEEATPPDPWPAEEADVKAAEEDVAGGDVDHYLDEVDEVVPLAVHRAESSTMMREMHLANSPVLTAARFSALTDYFLREFRVLLGMEDIRVQNVSVNVNVGAAYCCLARHGSYSSPLKHATFGEFVERMNAESMQLYFIKDCPPCVSRAVDMECGALNREANLTLVKIMFFSNENQSRSLARAVWDSEGNAFRLLDMENMGVTFNWSIFSLDESYIRESGPPSAGGGEPAPGEPVRNKTVAYPFEVEFRAFRRWKQHDDHPAAPLAEAILEKLSLAEHNLINHGSSVGYERMDLSHVCEVDFASEDFNVESIVVEHTARAKPEGTDLLVDNTTSLFIENFAAARQLKERIAQYGPKQVATMQSQRQQNYMREMTRGGATRGRGGRGAMTAPNDLNEALKPTSKLTFFRSRGSTIHWKFHTGRSVEENIAPMTEALRFMQQVLHTANDIERTSARGGAAPEAL